MSLVIINLIEQAKYFGIFTGTFFEGPAVGLLAGFLSRMGILSLFLAYTVHVIADFSADFLYYYIGSQGHSKFFKKIHFSEKNIIKAEEIKKIFYTHPKKIIILGKLTHIIGLPILLGAGMAHYSWRKFLIFDLIATLIKSFILISLGYYLAEAWTKANNIIAYVSWFGLIIIFSFITFLVIKKLLKNL